MLNAIPSGFLNIVLYSIPRNPNLIIEALVILQSQILEKTTGSQGGGADFMKQLMGPSADDKSTLQSRYCDVQLPEDCFRIFAVQELEKLHRSLDGIHDASRTHVPAQRLAQREPDADCEVLRRGLSRHVEAEGGHLRARLHAEA